MQKLEGKKNKNKIEILDLRGDQPTAVAKPKYDGENTHARTLYIFSDHTRPAAPPPRFHLNGRRPFDALRLQRAQHRLRQLHIPERLDRRRYFISLFDSSHSEIIRE